MTSTQARQNGLHNILTIGGKLVRKPFRITLNGSLGSGKSTVGRMLAAALNIPFISTGAIFRNIGKIENLDALQTNLAAENNLYIDQKVDEYIMRLNESDQSFILDSRMGWHFLKDAFNIFLHAHSHTSASRIFSDQSRQSEQYISVEDAEQKILARRSSERRRYFNLYGVDIENRNNYALFISTDGASIGDVEAVILGALDKKTPYSNWISRFSIVPLMSIRELDGQYFVSSSDLLRAHPIKIYFFESFGYAFEEPFSVASCLMSRHSLVPFVDFLPPYIKAEDIDARILLKSFPLSHFYDWSELGNCQLRIIDELCR